MGCEVNEMVCAAILVLQESVAKAGRVGQVGRRKSKKSRLSVLSLNRFDKGLRRYREDCVARARRHHFVGINNKNGEDLRAVGGREMRAARANGKFPLARGGAIPKLLHHLRA